MCCRSPTRGRASFTRTYADEGLVWETLKEKRELFHPKDFPEACPVNRNSRWLGPGSERIRVT